jgi:hypothetical protein
VEADIGLGAAVGVKVCVGVGRVTTVPGVALGVEATPHATCAKINSVILNKRHTAEFYQTRDGGEKGETVTSC